VDDPGDGIQAGRAGRGRYNRTGPGFFKKIFLEHRLRLPLFWNMTVIDHYSLNRPGDSAADRRGVHSPLVGKIYTTR
jgi:hypothetical protein